MEAIKKFFEQDIFQLFMIVFYSTIAILAAYYTLIDLFKKNKNKK